MILATAQTPLIYTHLFLVSAWVKHSSPMKSSNLQLVLFQMIFCSFLSLTSCSAAGRLTLNKHVATFQVSSFAQPPHHCFVTVIVCLFTASNATYTEHGLDITIFSIFGHKELNIGVYSRICSLKSTFTRDEGLGFAAKTVHVLVVEVMASPVGPNVTYKDGQRNTIHTSVAVASYFVSNLKFLKYNVG